MPVLLAAPSDVAAQHSGVRAGVWPLHWAGEGLWVMPG